MRSQISPTIRLAAATEIIPLRGAILRPGRPLADSHYTGDYAPDTLHGGAFLDNSCIGAGTFLREPLDNHDAYRLRGMAVEPAYQQRGIGRSLLEFLVERASEKGVHFFWCNARAPAIPFYRCLGWQIVGEPFDIPEAGGTHYRMTYRIKRS